MAPWLKHRQRGAEQICHDLLAALDANFSYLIWSELIIGPDLHSLLQPSLRGETCSIPGPAKGKDRYGPKIRREQFKAPVQLLS